MSDNSWLPSWLPGSGAGQISRSLGPNSIYDQGAQTIGGLQDPSKAVDWSGSQGPNGSMVPGGIGNSGFGWNLGTAQLGVGGLGALASLWNGMKAQGLAQQQFDFTKQTTNTNLANSLKSYNTQLEDRTRTRGLTEGWSPEQTADYLSRNRLAAAPR